MKEREEFKKALLSLKRIEIDSLAENYCKSHSPESLIEDMMMPVMENIGNEWENGDVSLAQIYMSGKICENLVNKYLPEKFEGLYDRKDIAIVSLEDNHLLGKRIVKSVLTANRINAIDYGRKNVSELIDQSKKDRIKILLISTLMLSSALKVKQLREELPEDVKIIVGDAPFRFDNDLWRSVGADAMCRNASEVIDAIDNVNGGGNE